MELNKYQQKTLFKLRWLHLLLAFVVFALLIFVALLEQPIKVVSESKFDTLGLVSSILAMLAVGVVPYLEKKKFDQAREKHLDLFSKRYEVYPKVHLVSLIILEVPAILGLIGLMIYVNGGGGFSLSMQTMAYLLPSGVFYGHWVRTRPSDEKICKAIGYNTSGLRA
ncbi:hypothetical protein OAU52_00615 [bacterium]|nr:hypothetical protein [bacterium]